MYGFGRIRFHRRIDPSIQYPHGDVARAMIVFAPDIEARHFLDVGAIVHSDESPYRAELIAVMSGHGLVPAPPQ